ncbi:unnamed protein product, partial [Rotaria sordida]
MSTSIDPLPFNPMSVIGTLGAFFTFELTIRSTHKLIKTGPYAYVRHPSY